MIVRASHPPGRHVGSEIRHVPDFTLTDPTQPSHLQPAENRDLGVSARVVNVQVGSCRCRAVPHVAWRESRQHGRQWRGMGGHLRQRQSRRFLRSRRRIAFCARSCSPHVQRSDRVDAGPCSTWPGVRAGRMAGGGEECEVDCGGTQVGDLANSLASDLDDEIAISG